LIFPFYYREPLFFDKRATNPIYGKYELKSLVTWKQVCDSRQHATIIIFNRTLMIIDH